MEQWQWREELARLKAERKYYAGVRASFLKHPIEAAGSRSAEQQRANYAAIVERLDGAISIAEEYCGRA